MGPSIQLWEFCVLKLNGQLSDYERLDSKGKEGWSLVSIIIAFDGYPLAYMQRPLSDAETD